MAFYPGQFGRMYAQDITRLGEIDDKYELAKVANWQFNQTQAVIEATALGDTDRIIVPGVRSLTGSCRIFYYSYTYVDAEAEDPTLSVRNDCARMLDKIMKLHDTNDWEDEPNYGRNGHSESVVFRLELARADADSPKRFIDIPAHITGVTMGSAVGEVSAADITFEASGAALKRTNIQDFWMPQGG